jgi:chromosome segregation protein
LLKLKRIELQGFKSFCERTELKFTGAGIAAVVGPNGCGKSNLSDAISWVLGEQSARSLRGARMEDVIFAGTRERKPLGMAAVTMTMVQPEDEESPVNLPESPSAPEGGVVAVDRRPAGHKPGEITITRRLFRSGESEYLINGHIARLRDIQDIFMGSGLGPESYAIIEQGRIGQILSSKPQDRRAVLEEAAGITRYKARRRLAEAKLETSKQNLARVFDILEEVGRQVNSLKRQAAKTRRYDELKTEMDGRLRLLLAARYRDLEAGAAAAEAALEEADRELKSLFGQLSEKEEAHAQLQAACYEVESRLTEVRREVAEWKVEAERARGRLENQANQSASIEQRMARGEEELQDLDRRLAQSSEQTSAHLAAVAELERRTGDAQARLLERNQWRESLQGRLRGREEAMEAARISVLRLLGEASTLRNQLAQIGEYLAGVDRERARSEREAEGAAADLVRLGAARTSLSDALAARRLELEAAVSGRRRSEEELAARKRGAAEARRLADELRAECGRLKARRDSLSEILLHRSYSTESVKRLFGVIEKGGAEGLRPLGVLADFVEADPAFEKAAEEFLHDELEYVVVESWQQAERGIDLMRASLDGRATFLVHPEKTGEAAEPAIGPETGIAARLSDHLRLTNGLKDAARNLLPRLAHCFIAEDRAAAQRLSVEYPHLYFLLPDGVCYHGHALTGGKKAAGGPLAIKREVRELTSLMAQKQGELDGRVRELADVEAEIARLEEDVERLRGLQQAAEKDALAFEHDIRKCADETARANSRVSVARLEIERLGEERKRSLERREHNQAAVAEKETARQAQDESLEAARRDLDDLQAEAARAAEEHSALRAELAGLEERRRAERNVIARLENEARERTARKTSLAAEIEAWGLERARLLADNIELDRSAAALAARILDAESLALRLAASESGMREGLALSGDELKRLRLTLDEWRESRSRFEVDVVKRRSEMKFLDETSRKELGAGVEELTAAAGVLPEGDALAASEREYQEIRGRIEAMGPVNPQALEEYRETQQRHDFLAAQRQDLIDSIRDTEKAIHEIDAVSRQRFQAAFEAINANFREAFQTLFGGGSGEMRLTDESNLIDSGIDMVASPPGKKLQNVLLLSGGEKALTALALLMAIFRYQPSPFCVLDEVDAPLDEANIERLMRLLREMSVETQFVIITHSKKTMESAQAMYGVTMQEPGVSRLVSVKFKPAAVPASIPA